MTASPEPQKAVKKATLLREADAPPPPHHVAIIMDGNGRWAAARGLPRVAGHRAGVKAVRRAIEAAIHHGVGWLTLFAFSSETGAGPRPRSST